MLIMYIIKNGIKYKNGKPMIGIGCGAPLEKGHAEIDAAAFPPSPAGSMRIVIARRNWPLESGMESIAFP